MNIDLNLFFDNFIYDYIDKKEWINKTNYWKNKWINETPQMEDNIVNPYHVLKYFYEVSPKNKITLASSGSIVTIVFFLFHHLTLIGYLLLYF
jgi:thiamine pyrophosphate-dependent acetolactate synthase large subunit-like protein